MLRLSPQAARILRWFPVLPIVFAVASAGVYGARGIDRLDLNPAEDLWLVVPVLALGLGTAIYLGSRVAPSHGRLAIVVSVSVLLVWSAWLFVPLEWPRLAISVGGIAAGAILAWRRITTEPVQTVRTAAAGAPRYKGTAPFQHSDLDRATFFGRDRELRSLLSLVLAEHLVVLFGKSGTGKSSLINAGLATPLIERGYFPMVVRLADPVRGPLAGLVDGVRTAAHKSGIEIVGGDESDLWSFFNTEFWSGSEDLLSPVLIVDQFEELFTLHAPAPRHQFITQLAELVRGRAATGRPLALSTASAAATGPPKIKILLSLREDYLADLEELARDIPGILQHRLRIGALTVSHARDAIVKPAALEHADFETRPFIYRDDALQRILSFLASHRHGDETVTGDEVEPAQLQLVCRYVEDLVRTRLAGRSAGARVEVSEADLGGENQLKRILEDFYDRTLASIGSPGERRRVQWLCERRLISGVGRRLTEAEDEIEKTYGVSASTLRQLVDSRLLRQEPRLGGVFYELSHDTLVGPILRSRQKRVTWERRVWVGAGALLIAYLGGLWEFGGRPSLTSVLSRFSDRASRRQAMDLASATLTDRSDPEQLLALPRARLRDIDAQFRQAVRSREGYAAMVFAAEDVRLQYPELSRDVQRLLHNINDAFQSQFGLTPPNLEAVEPSNPRIRIEGGSFEMGSPEDQSERQHPVTVSPFWIQEHQVTNAEYRRFDPSHDRLATDQNPVVDVNWYEAMAYAAWLGGSLPTEAQWEYASRGKEGRTYPWGEAEPTCERANFSECDGHTRPVNAGRDQGKTPENVYDLAGNVWEWCRDWYGPYLDKDEPDPLGPAAGSARVLRGGSFFDLPYNLRGASRDHLTPEYRSGFIGFRVAWSAAGGSR